MRAVLAGISVLALAVVVAGCGAAGAQVEESATPAPKVASHKVVALRACSSYKTTRPQSCVSKMGFKCSSYDRSARPEDCFSAVQRRARALAAKRARLAAARAAARAKA